MVEGVPAVGEISGVVSVDIVGRACTDDGGSDVQGGRARGKSRRRVVARFYGMKRSDIGHAPWACADTNGSGEPRLYLDRRRARLACISYPPPVKRTSLTTNRHVPSCRAIIAMAKVQCHGSDGHNSLWTVWFGGCAVQGRVRREVGYVRNPHECEGGVHVSD